MSPQMALVHRRSLPAENIKTDLLAHINICHKMFSKAIFNKGLLLSFRFFKEVSYSPGLHLLNKKYRKTVILCDTTVCFLF